MTTLQKALAYLDKANFDKFFETLDKAVGKNTELAMLKDEFILNKDNAQFHKRLRVFARVVLEALPTAHKFLTDFLKPTDFVGRQAELEQLHALLEAGEASVIVNGLGGVGKTTLARQYVQRYKENYHHIVWLEQQNTLLSALITNERLTEDMKFTSETEEDRFKRVMRELENTEGKNLLIIDNYEQKDADDKIAVLERFRNVQFNHWRVLFTSREQVRRFQSIDLSFLPTHEAIELFTLHCENKTFDIKTLKLLLKEVGKHTLTIELLAKSYRKNKYTNDLGVFLKAMQNKEYDSQVMKWEIQTERNKGNVSLYKHLLSLFNMEKWTTEEQYILKQFAVLPSLPIDVTKLLEWLKDDQFIYGDVIENLTNKGWLSTKDQQQYEMHRLLKVLIQKHLGVMWEDVKVMVESVKEELAEEKVAAKPLASQWLIEYAKGFLENINYQDNEIEEGYVWFRLGYIYHFMSFYDDAEQCYKKALVIVKKYKGTFNKEYAEILNVLGIILNEKGNYEKSIQIHQEALQIKKEVLGEKHQNYTESLHNLACVYSEQRQYKEAILLYQENLKIEKEVLGEKHPNYATSLNNLAIVYDNQEKYEEAILLYQEALQIRKEVLGKKHPDYASSLNNLAVVYDKQKIYKEAVILYQKTLEIDIETLGEEHHYTKKTKERLEKAQQALQNQTNTEL